MPKRRLPAILALLTVLSLHAAAPAGSAQEKVDLEVISRIKEEGLKRSQVMQILSYLTDVCGPRLTGSPNLRASGEWAMSKLTEWELKDARFEPWGPFGRGWTLEGFTANVVAPQFVPLIAHPKAWSPSTPGTVRGEVIYLEADKETDLEKYRGKLRGAIVLIAPPRKVEAHFEARALRQSDEKLLNLANAEPTGRMQGPPPQAFQQTPEQKAAAVLMQKKWDLCFEERPALVLEPGRGDGGSLIAQAINLPQPPPDTPADRRPRAWTKEAPATMPQVVVAVEHYNRILRMLGRGVRVRLEINIVSRFHDNDSMGFNVLAEIPGTDLRDEVVMVGGHLDSWHSGTGATDNAAGSAAALEAVRILQALGLKPRRTIRIALWGGEEQGLLGSKTYVREHFGRRIDPPAVAAPRREVATPGSAAASEQTGPPQPLPRYELKPGHDRLSAYFNLDNGTGKIRGIYLQGNEAVRPIFRAWLAPFKEMGATTLSISSTGGTDHIPFDAVGLPGFQFIQDPIEYNSRTHHSSMDVYERIQEDDMTQAATIIASFVYHAAMRDEKLPRKPLPGPVESRSKE
ncbi:MAG: M20/M25/M40 family metallo-hydrolase [Acidobacteria bacterium]|nr:M20/M25/M40 family metallo-hydrolase [Acidobacteriota bacterium]